MSIKLTASMLNRMTEKQVAAIAAQYNIQDLGWTKAEHVALILSEQDQRPTVNWQNVHDTLLDAENDPAYVTRNASIRTARQAIKPLAYPT